jgi:hypothetical protein
MMSAKLALRRYPLDIVYVFAFLLALLCCNVNLYGASTEDDGLKPFSDVPADHRAYDSVRRLTREGYLDGYDDQTFRGRKVITRYEFAKIVARMIAHMDKVKDGTVEKSPEESMLLDLVSEFRQELHLLGIRVNGADERLKVLEEKTDSLVERRSNIKMEGFYRASQVLVNKPVDYTDYPFEYDLNKYRHLTEEGLENLNQDLFLRFLGQPVFGGTVNDVQVFAEIKGIISGNVSNSLTYQFSDSSVAGDSTDGFATEIIDEQRVSLNRAHFLLKSKRGDLRVFSNESVQDLTDPLILLSNDVFKPDTGLEGGGSFKKFAYFGSVLRRDELEYQQSTNALNLYNNRLGNNNLDLWEDFYVRDSQWPYNNADNWEETPSFDNDHTDNYALRFTYEPLKESSKFKDTNLILGFTFNETVWTYNTLYDNNRVFCVDGQYDRNFGQANIDTELSILQSEGLGNIHDTALHFDGAYRNEGLLATMKVYSFGSRFNMMTARNPFVDSSINFNFKRTPQYELVPDNAGESLIRLHAKYDVPDSMLENLDDVTFSMLYETKSWAGDPYAPRLNDSSHGSRFYLQALADITDRTHFEFFTEVQKDIRQLDETGTSLLNEEGTSTNEFKFDYRIRDNVALVADLSFIDDFDSYDPDGQHFSMKRSSLEVNSQVFPWLFLKGSAQYVKNSDLQIVQNTDERYEDVPRELINGRDIHRFRGEAVLNSKSDFSLRANVMWEKLTNSFYEYEDMNRKVAVAEFGANFTRALKLRYVHSIEDRDMIHSGKYEHIQDQFNVNGYMGLLYRPTENTEFEITYGDDYEDPEDRLDNGAFNFFRTAKILQLKAQTAF